MKKHYKYKTQRNELHNNKPIDIPKPEVRNDENIEISPIVNNKIPKTSLLNKIRNDDAAIFFIVVIIFTLSVLSYTVFISSIDVRNPSIIKLKSVDNYSNFVTDECGYMYSPINPSLINAVTIEDKQKSTFVPIILNESDVYSVEIVSSKLTRSSMFIGNYITNFKLIDPSKYIKNCN